MSNKDKGLKVTKKDVIICGLFATGCAIAFAAGERSYKLKMLKQLNTMELMEPGFRKYFNDLAMKCFG
jgi:hypothetical protein